MGDLDELFSEIEKAMATNSMSAPIEKDDTSMSREDIITAIDMRLKTLQENDTDDGLPFEVALEVAYLEGAKTTLYSIWAMEVTDE